MAVLTRRPATFAALTARLAGARDPYEITGRPAFDRALAGLMASGVVRQVVPPRPARLPRFEVAS